MPDSVYIHIPYCKSKCRYCSFVSFTDLNPEKYIKALIQEINARCEGEEVKTLYFGGGTPSLLEPLLLKQIIDKFCLKSNCEITLEINPDDARPEYLKKIKEIGITRLSIGAQSFNDKILKYIGRRHTAEDTINAVDAAQKTGFENISLDLIYGLPDQTIKGLVEDLEIASSLGVQHISTYGLKIEKGTYFDTHPAVNLPDNDLQADMYVIINETLEKIGYLRYEISNFAQKGFESKHNLNYWNNEEYYGYGVSAHGYKDGVRFCNTSSLKDYLSNPSKHQNEHILSPEEKLEEEIFLGFRKTEGINTRKIKEKFGVNFEKEYKNILEKYIPGYIENTPAGFKLTIKGVLLSNIILAEFI